MLQNVSQTWRYAQVSTPIDQVSGYSLAPKSPDTSAGLSRGKKHGGLHWNCASRRAAIPLGAGTLHCGACSRDRGGLPALGGVREVGAARQPLDRRRHRAHADERRQAVFIQVRQRSSEEHRQRAAHGHRLRRTGGRRHGLSLAALGDDFRHGAANCGDLGACRVEKWRARPAA